ncbi:MAG: chloride channel protein [Culicoidibacterales bacterium]
MHSNWFRHIIFFTLLIVTISFSVITFGHLLNIVIFLHQLLPSSIILFSCFVGVITYFLYQKHQAKITRELAKLYTPQKQKIAIPIIHIPLIILTTLLSHLFGASVGREGVAVQIGGTFGSFFNRRKKQWDIKVPSSVIITSGMSAGFAALFGMPLTASLFAIEVSKLYKKTTLKWMTIPFITSLVAAQFSMRLGLSHMHFHVNIPNLTPNFLYAFLLLILLLFLATTLYLFLHHSLANYLKEKISSPLIRIISISFSLSLILFIFRLDSLHGLGSTLITQSFTDQQHISFQMPFLKIIFTLGFLAVGFKGGEVTPIFSIGAMLGAIAATCFSIPSPLFAIIGMATFFGATTKTYLAPLLLVLEITTPVAVPFALPLIVILYFTTPKIGIYQTK